MDPLIFFITLVIMSFIHITMWTMFPKKFLHYLVATPVFAFVAHMLSAVLITAFTGVASMVGIANLGASVVFMCWVFWYRKKYGILGLGVRVAKILWIPILPMIVVKYKEN